MPLPVPPFFGQVENAFGSPAPQGLRSQACGDSTVGPCCEEDQDHVISGPSSGTTPRLFKIYPDGSSGFSLPVGPIIIYIAAWS